MLLPIRWLKDYVNIDCDNKKLAEDITLTGSHVDGIVDSFKGLEGVITVKIKHIEKHPDADKLRVCYVDDGKSEIVIVTAAPNVKEGDIVPLATVGAIIAGGNKIEEHDFRGVVSYGMFCSLAELGYDTNVINKKVAEGVLILDEDTPIGKDIREILNLEEKVLDIEITPNRPDCLSVLGMAREAKATFNKDLKEPEYKEAKDSDEIKKYIKNISIDTKDCLRYYARVVKDVKIALSPLWMQQRLMESGVRPINNIVDITNYVMLELGEPLHAFDVNTIKTKEIHIKNAKEEKFTTLDEIERDLKPEDIVITDGSENLALGGIMGGLDSSITDATETIMLEGASFNRSQIRYTSKRLGLRTEASNRFEKGISPLMSKKAVDRAAYLIELLGVGTVVDGYYDIVNYEEKDEVIKSDPARINNLLGSDLSVETMLDNLSRLGIETKYEDGLLISKSPYYRTDLAIEEDIAEEVGRIYGFHNIEAKPIKSETSVGMLDYKRQIDKHIKTLLIGQGMDEILTYSFISPKNYDALNLKENHEFRKYIELINPLGEDFRAMRTTLIANMLKVLSLNINNMNEKGAFFEFGNTFEKEGSKYIENKTMSVGFYGYGDFYMIKDILVKILEGLAIEGYEVKRSTETSIFHKGRSADFYIGGEKFASLGQIDYAVCDNFSIKTDVYVMELDLEKIYPLVNLERKYVKINKFPAVKRDYAIVLDDEVPFGDVKNEILSHGFEIVKDVQIFDIYKSDKLGADKKSLAFKIKYQGEKTLKDKDIQKVESEILASLEEKFAAILRK